MKTILRICDNFENDEDLCVIRYAETRDGRLHAHEFWEIGYVYEGLGMHYTSDGASEIGENELVFLSPDIPEHSIASPPEGKGSLVRVRNCLWKKNYMSDILKQYFSMEDIRDYTLRNMLFNNEPVLIRLDDRTGIVHSYLEVISYEYNRPDSCCHILRDNAFLNMLVVITRLYEAKISGSVPAEIKNTAMDNLIKFMKANFSNRLTLKFLSEQVYLSPEYLSRCFKKYTGKTISDHLTEIRIKQANHMLSHTSDSITDIADYCGYTSIGNFQKAFKKLNGISPREYRKKYKKQ